MSEQSLADKALEVGNTFNDIWSGKVEGVKDFPHLNMGKEKGVWVLFITLNFKDDSSIQWKVTETEPPQSMVVLYRD